MMMDIVEKLEGFTKAYDKRLYDAFTDDELKQHSLIISRAGMAMGNHLSQFFQQAIDEIKSLGQQLADTPSKTEIEAKLVIDIEKLLCEKLNIQWAASGISVESLINRLAEQPQELAHYIERLELHSRRAAKCLENESSRYPFVLNNLKEVLASKPKDNL